MAFQLNKLLPEAAQRFPDRNAVVEREAGITYAALDKASDRVAAALLDLGVSKGDRVALYFPKSIASIVSIFGILKAGCAYVPIDPRAPEARAGYIMGNCGVSCLITQAKRLTGGLVAGGTGLRAVVLTDPVDLPGAADAPGLGVTTMDAIMKDDLGRRSVQGPIDKDLAYILYTSGSTGNPKGVMISHQTAMTFVEWARREFNLQSTDRVSSHAPLHFDLSVFDIFSTVAAGGTIFLVPDEFSVFPRKLAGFICEREISVWYSVPSILVHMLVHGGMGNLQYPDLRLVLFAGEVFPVKYLRQLMGVAPKARYFNLYGPTETNVCTYYEVREVPPADQTSPVPIGTPCDNIEVFILDQMGEAVRDPHVEGELYVRGTCVAQGYWGDQEKTAKAFLANPMIPHYGDVLYRTGDVVKYDSTGNLHLIGRKDHMVKSRGYRIELGEIESALLSHPSVREAAVVAVPDEMITNRLKGFVVLSDPETVTKIDLDKYLAERVPAYMVPETMEFLDALPKTSTGKIDRPMLSSRAAGS